MGNNSKKVEIRKAIMAVLNEANMKKVFVDELQQDIALVGYDTESLSLALQYLEEKGLVDFPDSVKGDDGPTPGSVRVTADGVDWIENQDTRGQSGIVVEANESNFAVNSSSVSQKRQKAKDTAGIKGLIFGIIITVVGGLIVAYLAFAFGWI